MAAKKKSPGRPTKYSEELCTELCAQIAQGKSLRSICEASDMPAVSSVCLWLAKYPSFSEQYARAKTDSADSDADRIEEIAEKVLTGEYEPAAARVAMDAYKWTTARKQPKKYSEKLMQEVSGPDGGPVEIDHTWEITVVG